MFKVLTLQEFWAIEFYNGEKTIEYRSWKPNESIFFLHCGAGESFLASKIFAIARVTAVKSHTKWGFAWRLEVRIFDHIDIKKSEKISGQMKLWSVPPNKILTAYHQKMLT